MIPAKTFEDFVALFTIKPSFGFEKIGKDFFLKNEYLDGLNLNNSRFVAKSLPLGKVDSFFRPSLFLLELLSKESDNKIFVNPTAEWFFLCGRDIFPENVLKSNTSGKVFLVQNEFDENIGLGMRSKIKGRRVIKNLLDRGDFLRREK